MARKAGMKTVFSTHSHYDPRAVRTPVPGIGVKVQARTPNICHFNFEFSIICTL